ncbi:hypothetical protein [Gordonia paraffinivorans]|uniref:hypothetical protein n=1 Tax=Gordonia paraffinivorans TaxID=175628 RepID=UPI0014485FD4|nr:hypothetical protein [Gordonia paraffinivorans]
MKTEIHPEHDEAADVENTTPENTAPENTGAESASSEKKEESKEKASSGLAGRAVSLRSVIVGAIAALVVAALVVMGWQLWSASSEVDDMKTAAANEAKAEQVALDYAKGAADMSFENPEDWRSSLTKGTSPELSERLRQASTQMEQLLRPLQWSSTATPIAAKVESVDGDVYQVVAFVNVRTKNVQAPSGIESTATYKITLDKSQDWLITAISSTGSNLDAGESGASEAGQAPAAGAAPVEPAPGTPGN